MLFGRAQDVRVVTPKEAATTLSPHPCVFAGAKMDRQSFLHMSTLSLSFYTSSNQPLLRLSHGCCEFAVS